MTIEDRVAELTGQDVEWCAAIIRAHQDRYPGGWQDWKIEDRAKTMAAIIRRAIAAGEQSPERIVLYFG